MPDKDRYSVLFVSDDHAAHGQSNQNERDELEPEDGILRARDRRADQKDQRKCELHLNDSRH